MARDKRGRRQWCRTAQRWQPAGSHEYTASLRRCLAWTRRVRSRRAGVIDDRASRTHASPPCTPYIPSGVSQNSLTPTTALRCASCATQYGGTVVSAGALAPGASLEEALESANAEETIVLPSTLFGVEDGEDVLVSAQLNVDGGGSLAWVQVGAEVECRSSPRPRRLLSLWAVYLCTGTRYVRVHQDRNRRVAGAWSGAGG